MRTRNIRPGFFADEELADLPFEYRLLYQGLWCLADVAGRLEERPKRIKAEIFPYDDVNVTAGIEKLVSLGKVKRYEVGGAKLLWLPKLAKHQIFSTREKEGGSDLPPPPEEGGRTGSKRGQTWGRTRVRPGSEQGPNGDSSSDDGRRTTDDGDRTTEGQTLRAALASRVLDRLNQLRGGGGPGFRTSPELDARIRAGVPEADLLAVVEGKVGLLEFEGGKFYRPATLFGPKKFQGYLDEVRAGPARAVGHAPPTDPNDPDERWRQNYLRRQAEKQAAAKGGST